MLPSPLDLTYFYETAIASSLSRAAHKLNISQPSLTLAIKRLETNLKKQLFIRHKQGVTLTRAGSELLSHVAELLDKWALTQLKVRETHLAIKGRVTIGCSSTLASLISEPLTRLLMHYPDLEIHLENGLTSELTKKIINGELDIGILIGPTHHSNMILTPVGQVEFAFWSALSKEEETNLYADETIIICNPNLPDTQFLINCLHEKRDKNLRISTANQFEMIAAMIEKDCIGILPSCWVEIFSEQKLQKIKTAPSSVKQMYLAYNFQNKEVAAVQVVWKALKQFALGRDLNAL